MLVLSRHRNQSVVIGDDIVVSVVDIRGDKVRLGVEAPREVSVHRKEVYEAIKREGERRASLPRTHEFDSSQTCNYCGIAVERVPGGSISKEVCPKRQ